MAIVQQPLDIAMIWNALTVFTCLFALDFVWARYVAKIGEGNATSAGVYAAAIIVLAGIAQISYVAEHWLLIPAAAGAFAGTAAGVMASR